MHDEIPPNPAQKGIHDPGTIWRDTVPLVPFHSARASKTRLLEAGTWVLPFARIDKGRVVVPLTNNKERLVCLNIVECVFEHL